MKKNKTAGEIDMQYMDYGKVYKFFKFKPTYNLDKGLKKSMEWYKLYFDE